MQAIDPRRFVGRVRGFAITLCAGLCLICQPSLAQNYKFIGFGTLNTNDSSGDGMDRWQTSSLTASFLFGPKETRDLPHEIGELLEFRAGMQIISPANTQTPAAGDRRMAGVLTSALHTHFARGGAEFDLGVGVAAVGPMTRVTSIQDRFHKTIGADRIPAAVLNMQIGNKVRPLLMGQAAYRLQLDDQIVFRPFSEATYGLESYARLGFDLLIGNGYKHGVFARDNVTGHLYQTMGKVNEPGVSAVFGADIARVFQSAYLPAPAYSLTPYRARFRGGMLVDHKRFSVFYGLTYLTPEFGAQGQGQVVGSIQTRIKF